MIGTPSGVESVTANCAPEIDLLLWLQPIPELTFHDNSVSVEHENIDSAPDALNDLEVTQIESLAYLKRILKPSKCDDSGIEMNSAQNIAPPDLRGPPVEKKFESSPPAEKLDFEMLNGNDEFSFEYRKKTFEGLMSKIKTALDQDLCYDEHATPMPFSEKPIDENDSSAYSSYSRVVDLSMWLMPVPDPGGS